MKINYIDIKSKIEHIDLFICSSGFESRSKSFALAIDTNIIGESVIFHIDENYIISYENLKKITNKIPKTQTVQHPKNNPIETYDIILNTINLFFENHKVTEKKVNVIIDVTTFTREVLLILFKAINQGSFVDLSNIYLVYTPAENYPCEWLTKGVRYIRSIFGYSGMILPSKKLMLVILNGFENERTEEIINSFEPNAILLGKPSYEDSINGNLGDRGIEKFEQIKQKHLSSIVEEFEFSCIEIDKTMATIEELINKYGNEYNIVLSPLNNKVSTIATAFVALKNENIQVCYASANQYNINKYSTPCDYFLIFEMNKFLT